MKILIADDEALVRNGLKNTIRWEKFGISTVLLAEDGVQAMRLAQQDQPEIILTDVRMQRMDGIELATRLRKLLPNSHLIFMSGYSDKEYLKAAIQLKAVSYVDKPIDREVMEQVIEEAVRLQTEYSSNLDAQTVRSRMEKAQLAVAMTQVNDQNEDSIRKSWSALNLPSGNKLWFSTVLVHLTNVTDCSGIPGLTEFMAKLQEVAQKKRISFIYSSRTESRLLLHLYRSTELTREHIAWFTLQMQKFLMNRFQFFIAAGLSVRGISKVGLSYQSAVETLSNSFYDDLNSILLWNEQQIPHAHRFRRLHLLLPQRHLRRRLRQGPGRRAGVLRNRSAAAAGSYRSGEKHLLSVYLRHGVGLRQELHPLLRQPAAGAVSLARGLRNQNHF